MATPFGSDIFTMGTEQNHGCAVLPFLDLPMPHP
jgi:hypothetical protein